MTETKERNGTEKKPGAMERPTEAKTKIRTEKKEQLHSERRKKKKK